MPLYMFIPSKRFYRVPHSPHSLLRTSTRKDVAQSVIACSAWPLNIEVCTMSPCDKGQSQVGPGTLNYLWQPGCSWHCPPPPLPQNRSTGASTTNTSIRSISQFASRRLLADLLTALHPKPWMLKEGAACNEIVGSFGLQYSARLEQERQRAFGNSPVSRRGLE